jgi:hypothetical protein
LWISESQPIVGDDGRIYACLAGQPNDPTYAASATEAYYFISEEGAKANFIPKDSAHRRGNYPAISVGVTCGPGSSAPVTVDNNIHADMAQRLLANEHIQRLAIFASGRCLYTLLLRHL